MDRVVVSGAGAVDEAMLTGESMPGEKNRGSKGCLWNSRYRVSNALLLNLAKKKLAEIRIEAIDEGGCAESSVTVSTTERKEIDMDAKLRCDKCGYEAAMPAHCNQPMHIDRVNGANKLVCWMGPSCGVADLPSHCGAPMDEVRSA